MTPKVSGDVVTESNRSAETKAYDEMEHKLIK